MCNAMHIHLTNVNHEVQLHCATSENECVCSCPGTQTRVCFGAEALADKLEKLLNEIELIC